MAGTCSSVRVKGGTALDTSNYCPSTHTKQQGTDSQRAKAQPAAPFCFVPGTSKPCKPLWFGVIGTCFFHPYLGGLVTQRAVGEGQDDLENALVVIELIAVLVTQPLPEEPEDPLPLCFVLAARDKQQHQASGHCQEQLLPRAQTLLPSECQLRQHHSSLWASPLPFLSHLTTDIHQDRERPACSPNMHWKWNFRSCCS